MTYRGHAAKKLFAQISDCDFFGVVLMYVMKNSCVQRICLFSADTAGKLKHTAQRHYKSIRKFFTGYHIRQSALISLLQICVIKAVFLANSVECRLRPCLINFVSAYTYKSHNIAAICERIYKFVNARVAHSEKRTILAGFDNLVLPPYTILPKAVV
jgi:hypothetical protein